jgi:hypothetical protein
MRLKEVRTLMVNTRLAEIKSDLHGRSIKRKPRIQIDTDKQAPIDHAFCRWGTTNVKDLRLRFGGIPDD